MPAFESVTMLMTERGEWSREMTQLFFEAVGKRLDLCPRLEMRLEMKIYIKKKDSTNPAKSLIFLGGRRGDRTRDLWFRRP